MIVKNSFGKTAKGENVDVYTIKNSRGTSVDLLTYGAIINSIFVEDKNGEFADVGCGQYILSDGDNIEWQYTCNLGEDLK